MRALSAAVARLAALAAIWLIRAYQVLLSPWIGPACRFAPTCSEYAIEAIATHGPVRGSLLGIRRLARCHPLGASGYDPVPAHPTPPARNGP